VYHVRSGQLNWLTNLVLPLLGLAFDAYVLYYAFFHTLLSSGSVKLGVSIVVFCLVWLAVGVGWALIRSRHTPATTAGPSLDGTGEDFAQPVH
jgi:hypothetical protein